VSRSPEQLQRLAAIRRLQEELDRRDLQVALGAVTEVEVAMAREAESGDRARAAGVQALADGDGASWRLASRQSEVAARNRAGLERLRVERAGRVAAAMQQFLESRREQEQVQQLLKDALETERVELGRREQAAADDWFLSRRARDEEE
jgi:phage protein D